MHPGGSNPPDLPTLLPRNPAPATYFSTSQIPCACHTKRNWNVARLSGFCFDFDFPNVFQTFSDHSHVQFFDILTSKGAPTLKCFDTLDFQNDSKRASPHNRVQILAFTFASAPAAAVPSLLFDPPGAPNYGKTQHFAPWLPFTRVLVSFDISSL